MSGKSSKRMRAGGRGTILLLSAFFVGSAALRIAFSTEIAWAQGVLDNQLLAPTIQTSAEKPINESRVEMANLLEALRAREAAVAEREAQMELRAKSLEVAQQEVERRIEALEAAEQRLRSTLALADTAAEEDIARLTAVYENMKPKEAATLFQAMEPEFAAGFLARMRPDAAAKILAGLDPQNAYSISAILAGRNANAPKN